MERIRWEDQSFFEAVAPQEEEDVLWALKHKIWGCQMEASGYGQEHDLHGTLV
jgi:hypothetical protein